MLSPEPVGATERTSRPASIAATTSDCPGLKASSPKTSLSVRSALSIIPPECDGISQRGPRFLTRPHSEVWKDIIGKTSQLIDFVANWPHEHFLSAGGLQHPKLVDAVLRRSDKGSITEISRRLTRAHEHAEHRGRLRRIVGPMHVGGGDCVVR